MTAAASATWAAVLHAETASDLNNVLERTTHEGTVEVRLPEFPRLELEHPDKRAIVFDWGRLSPRAPHLELRLYGANKEAMRGAHASQSPWWSWNLDPGPRIGPGLLWPEGAGGPTTIETIYRRPAIPVDERSAWARWHGSIWGASASVGALMFTMVAALSLLPREVSGWNKPNFYGLKKNFSSGPNFDYDHFYFNYIFHPYDGSEFYLIARNREFTWWQSFAYGAAVSTTFEFLIESAYEGASWQDLWITPVAGAVIGELRWQAKKALEDPSTGKPHGTANKLLYVIIDPLDAIFNL